MASHPALTLSDELEELVVRGLPQLDLERVRRSRRSANDPLSSPGRFVELVDSTGGFIAWTIVDPENEVLRVLSRDPDDVPDAAFIRRRVAAAFDLRERLGLVRDATTVDGAFRLVHGEGDGLGGVTVDVLGDWAVQWVLAKGVRDWGRRIAEAIADVAAARGLEASTGAPWPLGILQKVRSKDAARPGKPVQAAVHGEIPPKAFVARENGVPFEIHPLAGLNVGLFTDMRENRAAVGRFARDARVLNTFAYTGTLSVAAALAGSREVTSVDLSSGVLKWARENFRLSGLDPNDHVFETADIMSFLRGAGRKGERYDLVILDPPTYSAARAASWSLKKDLPELIARALAVLPPGGILWFSGNTHGIGERELESRLESGVRLANREVKVLETSGLPPDYPTPLGYREGRYLRLWIMRRD